MTKFLYGASIFALLIAAPALALAQDNTSSVDEVISTATRSAGGIRADQIGSSVSVITAQDFEDRQVRVVSDVLRDLPGVSVSRTGALGGLTQVRVRGAEANHVLTLIDGIEVSDPFFGEFDYSTLLADDLGRVEMLRGAQSALYGSDATAGVINYITPTGGQSPGVRLRAEGGSMGTYGAAARLSGVNGDLDYVFNAGYQSMDGYVGQTLPGGTRDLGSELGTLSAKATVKLADNLKVRGVVRFTDTKADTNSSSFGRGVVDTPGSHLDATSLLGFVAADLALLDGKWTHSLSAQGLDAERNGFNALGKASGDLGSRAKVSYVTTYLIEAGNLRHTLTGAFDRERETFQNTSPSTSGADTTERSIDNTGFVAQYDIAVGEVAGFGIAARYDKNDFFDNATTYRANGFYRVNDMIRLRAAAGTGIKNPSQTELFGYNATGPFAFVGNANLKPEESEGWEVGADFRFLDGRLNASATYFDAKLKDEIFSVFGVPVSNCTRPPAPPPGSCSTTGNRTTDSTQRGVELSGEFQINDQLKVTAAYTYLDAVENKLEEIRRPPHIASANITWRTADKRAGVNLNVRYNGETLDSNFSGINATTPPAGLPPFSVAPAPNTGKVVLPSFTLVNLSGDYDINDTFEVFARVENALDEEYYEVFSFPTPGRAVYAGVRARF